MERNANYTLVGFVTLISMVALVVFAVWLGRLSFNKDFDEYDIVFVGPVRGLTEGSEVHFNGIKVGEVTDLNLDRADPNRVIARARVGSDVPVRVDSYATLEPQGITFVSIVQITAGTPSMPLLKDRTPEGQVPVMRSQSSALSDLLAGGGNLLSRALETLNRVNQVLSDRNIANVSASIEDINVVTASMRDNTQLFESLQSAANSVDQAANEISAAAQSAKGLADNDAKRVLAEAESTAKELQAAAADARATISALRGPTTDFATNTLPQVQQAIVSLQEAAESIDRLAAEIQSNPRQLISKEPAKEIEVQP
jgi:phospholipid/cholesterol/gamma-HCH transport system substrate-binding protein